MVIKYSIHAVLMYQHSVDTNRYIEYVAFRIRVFHAGLQMYCLHVKSQGGRDQTGVGEERRCMERYKERRREYEDMTRGDVRRDTRRG